VALSFALVPPVLLSAPAAGQTGPDAEQEAQPIRVVVLVDESGSLSVDDVREEKYAASIIATNELSPRSQVAVVGFGSGGGTAGSPVDEVCPLTELTSEAQRAKLNRCVQDLRPRTDAEGNDTDFVAALDQAQAILAKPDDRKRPKIIFLLTDGRLDVGGNPAYGPDPATRNANAQDELDNRVLPELRGAGVQIWPLGFGDVDAPKLRAMAIGSAQSRCGAPQATIEANSANVVDVFTTAAAKARCAKQEAVDRKEIGPGPSYVDLHVTIPPIATDGAIQVTKRDPRITVAYFDPRDTQVPKSGDFDDSTFQVTNEGGAIEALRIRDPRPGKWRVRLTAPEGVARQNVSATVIWLGVLRTVMTPVPAQPAPGQTVTVHSRLLTRQGVVTDAKSLRDLKFGVTLSGDGFAGLPMTPLAHGDGGEFTGTLTVPASATGKLLLVGHATAPGVQPDERPYQTSVRLPGSAISAAVSLDRGTFHPGDEIAGEVETTSGVPGPRKARLVLTELDPGTRAALAPTTFDVQPGTHKTPFTVRLDPDTELGPAAGTVEVVDDADPKQVYGAVPLSVTVTAPPTWFDRALPWIAALLLLLVALVAVLWWRRQRRRQAADVRQLAILLYREDRQPVRLRAPARVAEEFRFVIRDEGGAHPRPDHPHEGDANTFVARRDGTGSVVLTTPHGEEITMRPGQREELPSGLFIGVDDTRRSTRVAAGGRERTPPPPSQPGVRRPPPSRPRPDAGPTRVTSPDDDELI
jgi:von Willebrand factor type A domain